MEKNKSISITVLSLVGGLLTMAPKAADATFTVIDFPNATSTHAADTNAAGDIVGRYVSAADGNTHGFLRNRNGEFIAIDFPNANFTVAEGINSRGDIVGNHRLRGEGAMVRHGFLLSKGTFTTIDPPGSIFTNALGIVRRGDIVGRYCTVSPCVTENQHGFLLSRGEFSELSGGEFSRIDVPGAVGTNEWGINDRGEIVGGYKSSNGKSHVYLLHEDEFTTIDFPNAVDTAPALGKGGINSSGDIVSYYCAFQPCSVDNDSEHGFLLSDGEFTTIDFPGGHATVGLGINASGDIVGAFHDAAGKEHGFLLNPEE
jgi:uncharacterized membrane protein